MEVAQPKCCTAFPRLLSLPAEIWESILLGHLLRTERRLPLRLVCRLWDHLVRRGVRRICIALTTAPRFSASAPYMMTTENDAPGTRRDTDLARAVRLFPRATRLNLELCAPVPSPRHTAMFGASCRYMTRGDDLVALAHVMQQMHVAGLFIDNVTLVHAPSVAVTSVATMPGSERVTRDKRGSQTRRIYLPKPTSRQRDALRYHRPSLPLPDFGALANLTALDASTLAVRSSSALEPIAQCLQLCVLRLPPGAGCPPWLPWGTLRVLDVACRSFVELTHLSAATRLVSLRLDGCEPHALDLSAGDNIAMLPRTLTRLVLLRRVLIGDGRSLDRLPSGLRALNMAACRVCAPWPDHAQREEDEHGTMAPLEGIGTLTALRSLSFAYHLLSSPSSSSSSPEHSSSVASYGACRGMPGGLKVPDSVQCLFLWGAPSACIGVLPPRLTRLAVLDCAPPLHHHHGIAAATATATAPEQSFVSLRRVTLDGTGAWPLKTLATLAPRINSLSAHGNALLMLCAALRDDSALGQLDRLDLSRTLLDDDLLQCIAARLPKLQILSAAQCTGVTGRHLPASLAVLDVSGCVNLRADLLARLPRRLVRLVSPTLSRAQLRHMHRAPPSLDLIVIVNDTSYNTASVDDTNRTRIEESGDWTAMVASASKHGITVTRAYPLVVADAHW